jgi:nucleoid DNA-binding protein
MADNKSKGGNGASADKAKRKTKAEIFKQLAEATKLTKNDITAVFENLTKLIQKELGKKGPGEFVIPGLLKLKVKRMPATKQQVKDNPFKPGEKITVKAKPARSSVRARALKALNDGIK